MMAAPQGRPRLMTSTAIPFPSRWQMPLLLALIVLALAAGLGLREPMPADEPRFVLMARTMLETGEWLFPRRGIELYAEKPPVFLWLQAASYRLVGDWRVSFLLPSLLAALASLWLAGDLARRLWGRRAMLYAVFGLFVCLQFGLQAKRAQIDMVLVAMTTLSLWALLRYLLERPDWRLLLLGGFAAGLGTVTKGVGFLPLLVFLPWLWVRAKTRHSLPAPRAAHLPAIVAGFLLGAGVWLLPMLLAVMTSGDPALHAYARELLLKQTATRYADAWHHVKPAWYYLQTMLTLWLPGVLLAPWLLPAWWRRLRRIDPRYSLLLGWAMLVLAFFSLTPGKREVYVFPILPVLCVAAAPLLPVLLRRRRVRILLWIYIGTLAVAALAAAAWLLAGPQEHLHALIEDRGMDTTVALRIAVSLLLFGALALGVFVLALWRSPKRPGPALVVVTAALWMTFGIGVQPALSPAASAQALMAEVGRTIGPDAELALLGWREQHRLQADRAVVDFGFKRPWSEQWPLARDWLLADPDRRWLFLREEAAVACLDPARRIAIGESNRRTWLLAPGRAWIPGCEVPTDGLPDADEE